MHERRRGEKERSEIGEIQCVCNGQRKVEKLRRPGRQRKRKENAEGNDWEVRIGKGRKAGR